MCDFGDEYYDSDEHECARCGAMFCPDHGYLRKNETGESDWLCFECDAELSKDAMRREYIIALREGGYNECFPEHPV